VENFIFNICNICNTKNSFKNYKYLNCYNQIIFRDKMMCSKCLSQERHRFIWEYIKKNNENIKNKSVVHCSSELSLVNKIKKFTKKYYKINLNPHNHEIKMDILNMDFQSNTIDMFISSHVLEHIKNDDLALKEINRILKKDGIAILLVPIEDRIQTVEFKNPNEDEFSHYRNYGHIDFINKLKLHFNSVKRILPKDILNEKDIELYSLSYENKHGIFECKNKVY
jgi:SAM-dependent methyltransferase